MTRIVNRLFDVTLHHSTLHRYFKQAGMVWRRAAPTSITTHIPASQNPHRGGR
nr:winged helix-turn-helix domain-containing protein [Dickeya fangzhongdai]